MGFHALHRLRRRSRGIAAATVALFALNWLGLALMPCAMAYAMPAPAAHASYAAPTAADDGMSPECHARMAAAARHAGPDGGATPERGAAGPGTSPDARTCPWCLEGGPAMAGHADAACGATPKPALDARDVKTFQSPLLIALSAEVLELVPRDALVSPPLADDPVLPPATPAQDRYCRRLE